MKKFFFGLVLLALAGLASATDCAFNGALQSSWPACNVFPPGVTATPVSQMTGEQRQQMQQAQAALAQARAAAQAEATAGVSGSGNSRSRSGVNGSGNANLQNVGNGGGASLVVEGAQAGSGDSYVNRTLFLPNAPLTPPVALPTANMLPIAGMCGPLVSKYPQAIEFTTLGAVYGREVVQQGYTYELIYDHNIGGDWYEKDPYGNVWGKRATAVNSVVSGGFVKQVNLFAAFKDGAAGGGAGASGANQQLVKDYVIEMCLVARAGQRIAPPPRPVYKRRPAPPPQKCLPVACVACCSSAKVVQ